MAPRNRKAYASKRLQQVVNDFREQRRRAAATETTGDDNGAGTEDEHSSTASEGDGDVEPPRRPAARRGKARGGSSVGDAGKRRGRGRGRGRVGARGARAGPSRKRKRSVTASSRSGSDGDSADGQDLRSQTPPPPGGTASRPRARPAFRGRGSQGGVSVP